VRTPGALHSTANKKSLERLIHHDDLRLNTATFDGPPFQRFLLAGKRYGTGRLAGQTSCDEFVSFRQLGVNIGAGWVGMDDQDGIVYHLEAPESQWDKPTRSTADGNHVTSALEIAGDEIRFPASGAIVRAVPMRSGPAISVPGDTFWKGATGMVPEEEAPPEDILMHCTDGEDRKTLRISWDMSWSDVLDLLKESFHRACVFE
jgi:hypothetical protein